MTNEKKKKMGVDSLWRAKSLKVNWKKEQIGQLAAVVECGPSAALQS